MGVKIAVAGAGIYGATVAIRLAEQGHQVHLFDPLGVLRAASPINQYRVHAGYHYPRSSETITEIAEARAEFTQVFASAIVSEQPALLCNSHKSIRSLRRICTRV